MLQYFTEFVSLKNLYQFALITSILELSRNVI